MPNPSTIASTLHDELDALNTRFANRTLGKATRQAILNDIRRIERELGLD